mmetsp:Transcript_23281/g.37403  ORF Transcript_23281/g.37403 Transcript_23281/m.37403 type:complete len:81 (-) Transcript_23281:495-737(-)
MSVSTVSYTGKTALMLAAERGHMHVVKFMVMHAKASVFSRDGSFRNAYDHAMENRNFDVAEFLAADMKVQSSWRQKNSSS